MVIVILALLAFMLLSALAKAKVHGGRNRCVANLKMIGFSFRIFAGNHERKFPFATTSSIAFQNTSNAWVHFLTVSNELGSPKNLMCPQDDSRHPSMAYSFGSETNGLSTLQNQAVSYFMGLDADEANRDMVLAGDRNLAIPGQQASNNLLTISGTNRLQWNHRLHANKGYAALSDGSVSFTASNFPVWKDHTNLVRLLLPD